MHVILRRLALWILRDELAEREFKAARVSNDGYKGGGAAARRSRVWWAGYAQAIRALRRTRWDL